MNAKFDHLRPNKNTIKSPYAQSAPIIAPAPQAMLMAPAAALGHEDGDLGSVLDTAATEPGAALAAAGLVALAAAGTAAPAPPMAAAGTMAEEEIEKQFRLPSIYRNKLCELLNIIKNQPNLIRAAPTGELVINNNLIPHSIFSDVVRELYLHSSANSTIGLGLLLNSLKSLNVSPNLISNSLRKAEYITLVQAIHNPLQLINTPKVLKQKGSGPPISQSQSPAQPPPGKRPCVLYLFKK